MISQIPDYKTDWMAWFRDPFSIQHSFGSIKVLLGHCLIGANEHNADLRWQYYAIDTSKGCQLWIKELEMRAGCILFCMPADQTEAFVKKLEEFKDFIATVGKLSDELTNTKITNNEKTVD